MHVAIVGFLGHFSIFLVPLPLVTLAIVILVAKSCIDENFRSMPIGQKITFSLLAAIFPISSTRPANAERAAFVAEEKDASSELMLHHLLHLGSWMVWAAVYVILMQVSPTFEETMGKIEMSSGLNSTSVIFLGCPVAIVSSILIRLLHNRVQTWSIISSGRSCCGCCPPKLISSYREIVIEDVNNVETVAAEVDEMIDYVTNNRNN